LDILHVASALSIKAKQFMTFDDRQSKLASLAGLRLIKLE
jgi:predicted nucleic acid-binding protein